jgi:hypothetical protein
LASAAIEAWSNCHGVHPDYLMTVRLRQSALQNAREMIVRRELYDLIEQQDDEDTEALVPVDRPLHQPVPASAVPWNLRWNDAPATGAIRGSRSRRWRTWCGRTRISRSGSGSRRRTC